MRKIHEDVFQEKNKFKIRGGYIKKSIPNERLIIKPGRSNIYFTKQIQNIP